MKFKHILFAVALLTFCLGIASGQDYRATVQGVVTDSSEAIIQGAKVTLLNVNTGVSNTKESNNSGLYRFDYVEPGTYSLTAEVNGFNKAVQDKILVQTRGDITVNFTMKPGAVTESVTVSTSVAELQFNTSSKQLVIDKKQLMDLPVMARNPFTLAILDPAVQNVYPAERNPFFMWSASQLNIGGRTARQNDLLIDGMPVQVGPKGSYTPTMDAVQEFTVQQNSVDAESGHSAGGIISMALRSGTNEVHGSAYYFGRNPSLNAATNAITHSKSQVRNHTWGGTVGGPIKKNKLFMFFAYEQWKTKDPMTSYFTMPTDLQRTGDFSASMNKLGQLRTIYDPYSTVYDAAGNVATRQPFAGNKIPASMIDPTSKLMMDQMWGPNNPGDGVTGINNFKATYSGKINYWNFSNRTDWNISDKLKIYGRYSRFHSQPDQDDFTPNHSIAMTNGRGGLMASRNYGGEAIYTLSPTTILDGRFSYAGFQDDYDAPKQKIGIEGLSNYWPGNAWYMPYAQGAPDIYFPALNIGGNTFGMGGYWIQEPHNYNWSAKVSKYMGKHDLKAGFENRKQYMFGSYPNLMGFNFDAAMTANTFLKPDTSLSGDPWASFLLGSLANSSYSSKTSWEDLSLNYYAAFVQDDFKVSKNVTLNLGFRYEYESAPVDVQNRYSRYLDLTNPVPEMQAAPPVIPDWINQLRTSPAQWNGAWLFADSQHRSQYNPQKFNWAPRVGVAIRINDKTAFQFGYTRYTVFPSTVKDGMIGKANFPGYSVTTNAAPVLEGIPQAKISDPFPATNPLLPVVGNSLGRYTNLGGSTSWHAQKYDNGTNQRFNFTLQRELPGQFKADITFYMHRASNIDVSTTWDSKPVNMADPNYLYTYKGEMYQAVDNPFYNYLTPDKFPGYLRYQQKVSAIDLLRPYPQYGDLYEDPVNGAEQHYQALQMRVQRAFANGLSVLASYNYNREQVTWWPNDEASYRWKTSWRDGENYRHRFVYAGSYDLPFGKGRPFLSNANRFVNAVLGGWSTSELLQITSGALSTWWSWSGVTISGDPRIDNPTSQQRWDTSKFAPLPDFTPYTSPNNFRGVGGPRQWNLDATLSKHFPVRERWDLEFRAEAYNLTNSLMWAMPDNNYYSSNFGKCTSQSNKGREMQYTLRLTF